MKALTFPEFFGMTWEQKRDYGIALTNAEYKHTSVIEIERTLNNWYYAKTQQQFKPEMIVELFGGITDATDEEEYPYATFVLDNHTFEFGEYYDECLYTIDEGLQWFIPKTIDDFIHNCRQANIDLEWK